MWIPPENKDPIVLHHPTRRSVGYFGAVRVRDGKFFFRRETDKFNAVTFWAFLRELRPICCAGDRRVVLIADNAKYHHAKLHKDWRQDCKDSFSLEFLPPYSPQLNPIERLWKLVRRLCLHNRYFPELEMIVQSVERHFGLWRDGDDTLRRLCAIT